MRERGREARKAKRTRRRNAAWITLASGGAHIPCVLWDISDSGARLAAPRANVLPGAFNLLLSKDGRSTRLCRVVWRTDRQLGVKFIEGDLEEEAQRRMPVAAGAVVQAAPSAAAAALLLPGYGPNFLEKPARQGVRLSSFAAGMLVMLMAATALFFTAGMQSGLDVPWAQALCDSAGNFCRHPEWTGMTGGLMAVVYLAVRGMEA
jgi:hypothetical protein